METQIRFRVESIDNFWYHETLPDAIEFAEEWRKVAKPIIIYKVCETRDNLGLLVERLEQKVTRIQ